MIRFISLLVGIVELIIMMISQQYAHNFNDAVMHGFISLIATLIYLGELIKKGGDNNGKS